MYSAPDHKHLSARHAPGTVVKVYGEFGDDYLIDTGIRYGFMPKSDLRAIRTLTSEEVSNKTWDTGTKQLCTVYTGGRLLSIHSSATGYSDQSYGQALTNGSEVYVIAVVGDMVQLERGGFIEQRYLDPDADHTPAYATVKTAHVLNRLIVRGNADKDAHISYKLCSGVRVEVVDHTDEWACIAISGTNRERIYGHVQMKFLVFGDEQVDDGSVKVRTIHETLGYSRSDKLPAGTELTVIGVSGNYGANADYDYFLCTDADGALYEIRNDDAFEVIQPINIEVKTSSKVNLREGPGKSTKSLTTIAKGKKVTVLLRGEIWSIVTYGGKTGYMMSKYLNFP